jgi:predicted double-glycine peptidase
MHIGRILQAAVRALAISSLSLSAGVAGAVDPWEEDREESSVEEPGELAGFVQPGVGTLGIFNTFGGIRPRTLRPLTELRWDGLVRQRLDAGCGPASLATIYTHYLDLPVSERDMSRALTAEAIRSGRGQADIRARGYALGDLKRVVDRSPLVSAAFQAPVESLHTLKIPVITQVNIRGYGHFVVLRGVVGDRVVVADPNFGNLTYPMGQFRDLWSGVMLAIGRPKQQAVPGGEVDPTDIPMVKEIDYAGFVKNIELPNMQILRFQFSGAMLSAVFGGFVPGTPRFPLVGAEATHTYFNP